MIAARLRNAPRSKLGAAGFTMIEIIVALAIGGLMLTLALTGFQSVIVPRRVQNTAREFASLLRSAQQSATANAAGYRCVGVVFGSTGAEVRAVPIDDTTVSCDNPTAGSYSGSVLLRGENYPIGVTLALSTGASTGTVSFLPSGAPCAGANCAQHVVVSAGAASRRVCIAAGTGLIEVVETATCP